jgi:hypothetical protein
MVTDGMLADDSSGVSWHACRHLEGAPIVSHKALVQLHNHPEAVSWNTLIHEYAQHGEMNMVL